MFAGSARGSMSKLKELVSKGVRLIVTDVPDEGAAAPPPMPDAAPLETAPRGKVVLPSPRKPAARTLSAEDVMGAPPVPRTTSAVPATTDDFDAVYKEAG